MFDDHLFGANAATRANHLTVGGHELDLSILRPARPVLGLNQAGPGFPVLTGAAEPIDPGAITAVANTIRDAVASTDGLLSQSSFTFALNNAAGQATPWSVWARGSHNSFNGKPEDDFSLDGEVSSGYLGFDYRAGPATRFGLAISESSGDVDYKDGREDSKGDLDADLTSVLPYIQWQPTEHIDAWAALGYGTGDAELATDGEGEGGEDDAIETDIEMRMAAFGVRSRAFAGGEELTWGRAELAWKVGAFAVEMKSDEVADEDLPDIAVNSKRLRVAMEGRMPGEVSASGGRFTPNWETGLRWDEGDAEEGAGADVRLGFDYANPTTGWEVSAQAGFLVAHAERDYDEWDAGLQARFNPGAQGGITFTFEPTWDNGKARQRMGLDFSNTLGKQTGRAVRLDGLRMELSGAQDNGDGDSDVGLTMELSGSLPGRRLAFSFEPAWKDGRTSQRMGLDFSSALGKWMRPGLRLELAGERNERDDVMAPNTRSN